MARPTLWECDQCGLRAETADYGGPDGWTTDVSAHLCGSGRATARGYDFCPDCATHVDTVAIGLSGTLIVKPAASKARKAKGTPAVELDLDDGPVDPENPADTFTDGLDGAVLAGGGDPE